MKSKKRHHHSSSEESDLSEITFKSSSSSGSDTDGSSASEHKHKKKKKRAESSDSESESDDQKRVKKRKHKKKKKKHGKKKRRTDSVDESASELEEISSTSEGEIDAKKKRKHKHKHSKRSRDSLARETAEEQVQRRIHSVVKERRDPSDEAIQPSRTYYQKEYRRSESVDYERQREVQRFYRGSSKDRKQPYQEQYNKEHSDRYGSYQQDKFDKNRDKYGQYHAPHQEHDRRPREYNEHKRNPRYEDNRPPDEEFQRRPREDAYNPRQEPRAPNRYNSYEERGGQKRREFVENREYRDSRRMPPEVNRIQNRDYQERKERFREEPYNSGRPRELRRDNREGAPSRDDRLPAPPQQNHPRPRSPDERYRERNRRQQQEPREEKQDRYRDGRGDRKEQPRNEDRKPERNRDEKIDPRARERKSRFTDAEEGKDFKWGKDVRKEDDKKENEKEMPNFGLSGKLTAEANTVNGVVIKYTEPDDAKQPKRRWRFYPFKGDKALPILYIHRQSAFLIGRDKKATDITLEHPSISKQHAVLQFRATPFTRPDGTQGRRVRPYIIDLDSANGTFVNNKKIEPRRYVELLERDVVKYGFSQREYVLLHENSKDDAQDDDNQDPPALGASVTTTDQIKHEKRIKQEAAADGE